MSDLILFWHRRDLRISDNIGLATAYGQSKKIVGVFCLDPTILGGDAIAPARVSYMIGCLQDLQEKYRAIGGQLLIFKGNPSQVIPKLAETLNAQAVFWNLDIEPYAKKRDEKVIESLKEKGITVKNFWDQLLHAPGEIVTQTHQIYTIYTPFWKNWSRYKKAAPAPQPEHLQQLTKPELDLAKQAGAISLPTAKELGFVWENPLLLEPGEQAALDRLEEFSRRAIDEYQEQRNYPGVDGTSQLSAALKFGAIGIRTVWQAAQQAYENSRSDEVSNSVQTWQQELAWREFYQHCLYAFPELAQGAYRNDFKQFPWDDNDAHFQAWCEGRTGYPIVDAAMRQLNEIGWMHNRCRMIVASFLTKDLIINWQLGEKYFMQKLFDGDLAANNGGWQWSASSGMDPKPLRIFNPASQAQKFDPEAEYIRQWLPEISSLDTAELVTGKIPPLERHRCNYPEPIVDHNQQQKEFKRRYQQIRGKLD
jgi:deoxyribodipyrimidine photo-lyase